MRKIFLELIAVGKRHHFPKEVMIVSSVMMFKWKLNVYRKMCSLLQFKSEFGNKELMT